MTKRCGHCGHELRMRPFRLLDDTCPNCGNFRHSVSTVRRATKIRILLYVAVLCVFLEYYFQVPMVIWLPAIWFPIAIFVWKFYSPATPGKNKH